MMYAVKMNNVNRMAPRPSRLPMVFDDPFFRGMMPVAPVCRPAGMHVEVAEKEDAYILEAELPGVAMEDIAITTENDVLTIAVDNKRRNCRTERRFALEGIDQAGITAASLNGILTITLPKEKPAGEKALRQIAIASGVPAAPALMEPATETEA